LWFKKGDIGEKLHGSEYLALITKTIMLVEVETAKKFRSSFQTAQIYLSYNKGIPQIMFQMIICCREAKSLMKCLSDVVTTSHRSVSKPQHFLFQ
jgi:hypothetical protein